MPPTYTTPAALGSPCPEFSLTGVDGRTYTQKNLAGTKAALVMFICNHCPYVVAVEDRLVALAREFGGAEVKIVAISSNDSSRYPADSFENMQRRSREKDYPFPYLYDESQKVARDFGAVCTPDFFLYDESLQLAYRGRLDDSWKDPAAVQSRELRDAIAALLAGRRPGHRAKTIAGLFDQVEAGEFNALTAATNGAVGVRGHR